MADTKNPFSLRCSQDSCFEVADSEIKEKIETKIDSLYKNGLIQYSIIDSDIKTNGVHYFIRLCQEGYNQKNVIAYRVNAKRICLKFIKKRMFKLRNLLVQ